MSESAEALSWACACLLLCNAGLFPFTPVFGFLRHLLISPASLETLSEASDTSLPPLVPSPVPRTKALARSQDLVNGQGLATYETSRPVSLLTCVLGVWERWEGIVRPEIGQKAGTQEAGAGKAL